MPLTREEERLTEEEKRALLSIRSMRASTAGSGVQFQRFLKGGTTGAELARNPSLQPTLAVQFNERANIEMRKKKGKGTVPRKGTAGSVFDRHVFDFHTEQQNLRREFIANEVVKRFGPQNITSASTVLTPGGGRTLAPGLETGKSVKPTQAQLDEIAAEFRTPLQKITGGANRPFRAGDRLTHVGIEQMTNRFRTVAAVGSENRRKGAAALRRLTDARRVAFEAGEASRVERRRVRKAARQTILTSDADAQVGDQTILG